MFRIEGLELMIAQAGNLADGTDIVCVIDKKVATDFVSRYHYSQKGREASDINYGCWHGGELVTVISYSYPVSRYVVGDEKTGGYFVKDPPIKMRWLELVRMAKIAESEYPLSKIVSLTLKDLTRRGNSKDGYYAIISYADAGVGHEGYIYQAANFIYCGRGIDRQYWAIEGQNLHPRGIVSPNSPAAKSGMYKAGEYKITVVGKHRYIYFCVKKQKLRDMLARCLKFDIEPYPKGQEKNYTIVDGKVEWQEVHK